MNHITNIVSQYQRDYPSPELQPVGASDDEINALELRLGTKLAPAHREFLSWMGNDVKGALYYDAWYLNQIADMTEYLPELFNENNIPAPDNRYVCFFGHHGYAMAWYEVPATADDPDIFIYNEGDPKHKTPYKWGKFSDWLSLNLEIHPLDTWRYREARSRSAGSSSTNA